MEPITFDLFDGYVDEQGVVHKSVIMRRLTQEDQENLLLDQHVQALIKSGKSSESANEVEKAAALIELRKFNRILFALLIESIGSIRQEEIQSRQILRKLSVRDINLISAKNLDSSIRLVPLAVIERAISVAVSDNDTRQAIIDALAQALGEDQKGRVK